MHFYTSACSCFLSLNPSKLNYWKLLEAIVSLLKFREIYSQFNWLQGWLPKQSIVTNMQLLQITDLYGHMGAEETNCKHKSDFLTIWKPLIDHFKLIGQTCQETCLFTHPVDAE